MIRRYEPSTPLTPFHPQVCERSSLLYCFLNGNLAILLFKF